MSAALRDIAGMVKERVGGRGYALFLTTSGKTASYASNAEREDVVRLLKEWLSEGQATFAGAMRESGQQMLDRMKQAEVCTALGEDIAKSGAGVMLFVFDLGEKGALSWFTNLEEKRAREGIAHWVEGRR